jgi:hypothetical protein
MQINKSKVLTKLLCTLKWTKQPDTNFSVAFTTQRLFDCLLGVIFSLEQLAFSSFKAVRKNTVQFLNFFILCFIISLFYSLNIQINPLPSNWIDLEHC